MPYSFDQKSNTFETTHWNPLRSLFRAFLCIIIVMSCVGSAYWMKERTKAREYQEHLARAAKAAHQAAQNAQADAYANYVRVIYSVAQSGIQTNQVGRYTIATANLTAYNSAHKQVANQIAADSKLSSDQKAALQKLMVNLYEDPTSRAQQINTQTIQQLRTFVNAFGVNALNDGAWLQAVAALKGPNALGELTAADKYTIHEVFAKNFP